MAERIRRDAPPIKFRVSAEERAEIQRRVPAGEVLAAWARRVLLGERRPRRVPPSLDPATLRELTRIGTNLNQVTRHLNQVARQRGLGDRDVQLAFAAMTDCRDELSALARLVERGSQGEDDG